MRDDGTNVLAGAAVGLAAGLLAALAMNGFQAAAKALSPDDDEADAEPATERLADRAAIAVSGEPLPTDRKPAAGNVVHYAFGALLGIGYGVAAEYRPVVTTGFGTVFGAGVALLGDEAAVPALGLAPPPARTPATTHLYGLVSHLVFGAALEGSRRVLRAAV